MMRWLWPWRKSDERAAGKKGKRDANARNAQQAHAATLAPPPSPTLVVERGVGSGRLGAHAAPTYEPRDALLRFARDALRARGAQVRVEDDDLVTATLADGAQARYTTTLARARTEADATLLVEGSAALATLYDEAAQRARVVALRLAEAAEPLALIADLTPGPFPHLWEGEKRRRSGAGELCGRCVGVGGEGWTRGTPTCAACPLREGRLALRWAAAPVATRVTRRYEATGVELTYRIGGRDRRGRRDEWLRLTIDAPEQTEQAYPTAPPAPLRSPSAPPSPARGGGAGGGGAPLTPEQIAQATAIALPADAHATLRAASARAQRQLTPALEAASAFLQQSAADEYQRRVADLTAHYERLRREAPEQANELAAAQARELAGLAEVYAVEVEATLENVAFVTTPYAEVTFDLPDGAAFILSADLGCGTVAPPTCAVCGVASLSGYVCAHGEFACVGCGAACGQCGAVACPHPQPLPQGERGDREGRGVGGGAPSERAALTMLASCETCGELMCGNCLRGCAQCGSQQCPDHLWACKECAADAGRLCLGCATLCARCAGVLCATHARACSVCGEALCGEHALACGECARTLCDAHASVCVTCQRPLCADHTDACEECGAVMCARDTFACLGCGRRLCQCAAPAACGLCQVEYCVRCLAAGTPNAGAAKGDAPTCPACRALASMSPDDLALLERASTWEREAQKARDEQPTKGEKAINLRQHWLVGRNAQVSVFVNRGVGRQIVYVVAPDGAVVHTERKGWLG